MAEKTLSEIAQGVLLTQIQTIQAQLEGCIEGKDPLYLHDLRVANRRIRAALIEFRGLFPDNDYPKIQADFQWIHQITGEVRDLDVGLSHFSGFKSQLPKAWQSHLKPLRTLQQEKRERAQSILKESLESDRLQEILEGWLNVLEKGILDNTTLSFEPAREYGCRRIIKRYSQIRKKGLKLTKKTPAEGFHSYRIAIKKLRYLMEFIRPVLDNEEFSRLRTGLKGVQDAFGLYQDTAIQIRNLRSHAVELHQGGANPDTLLAIGLLLGFLEKKLKQSKRESLKKVRWLVSESTARTFQSCFQYPME